MAPIRASAIAKDTLLGQLATAIENYDAVARALALDAVGCSYNFAIVPVQPAGSATTSAKIVTGADPVTGF